MSEEHVTGIERDLAALLDIDPSPQFAPRLRERIAEAPARRPWARWAFAAAAIVLVATGWLTMRATVTKKTQRAVVSAPGSTLVRSAEVTGRPAAPTAVRRRQPQPSGEARVVRRATDPEVIVDPAFRLAVQRLMRDPRRARTTIDAPATVPADGRPVDLAVAPMAVDDLAVPEIAVGEPKLDARR